MIKNKKEIAYLLSAIICIALIASIFYPIQSLDSTKAEKTNICYDTNEKS